MANKLDGFFSALSDPTRRAVITRLTTGPAPVSELHEPHDMALSSFLKHLRKLESAGMIRSEKIGRVRMIHIEAIPIAETEEWLKQQRCFWEGRLERLTALAEHTDTGESRLGLPRHVEVENHRNLATNVARKPRSSRSVRPLHAQISKTR